jgi:heat-inducible transcriptional repressor
MSKLELNERSQSLLKVLVERYIRDGQPVGSRTLARDIPFDLSAATIRNVMADLEEMGLIVAPHTSAGRVPTIQGYRFFIDQLLKVQPLQQEAVATIRHRLTADQQQDDLIGIASRLLAELSAMAGIVMIPRLNQVILRQVEFLPLSHQRVLVILVVNEREVQNRILHTPRDYSESELREAANYLNHHFGGCSLQQIRQMIEKELSQVDGSMSEPMRDTIAVTRSAFMPDERHDDYVLTGQTNLISYTDLSDMERLRRLFDAFISKRDLLQLFDQALNAQGVQIFIGEESGYQAFANCSLVTATYQAEGQILGVLGVIGPTRMSYERVIPLVDVTAHLLGAALNHHH